MRLSSYFADAGEVFVYNLRNTDLLSLLDGDYVIVYSQSVGGQHKSKTFSPTTDRQVKIESFFQPDQDVIAAGSFMRFNEHFRTIRELVIYPTPKGDKIAMTSMASTSQKTFGGGNATRSSHRGFMVDEAGVRFSSSTKSCRSFGPEDFTDAHLNTRDRQLEHLFQTPDAIRSKGSTISFGMVVNNAKSTGYEFCQLEIAPSDEGDRMLIVCIKIPDDGRVSSLYIKDQPLEEHMYNFVEQHFLGIDNGHFVIKEYGVQADERSDAIIPQRREFSSLELGEGVNTEQLQKYTRLVARYCLDNNRFNTGVFEEWRHSIPSLTVDQHLQSLYQAYTREKIAVAEELDQLRLKLCELKVADDDQIEDLDGGPNKLNSLRQSLYALRDAKMYIAERRKGLEYERVQEYKFGLKTKKVKETVRETSSRTNSSDQSESGSSTSSGSSQSGETEVERNSKNQTMKQVLLSIMTDTKQAVQKGMLGNGNSCEDEMSRKRRDEQEDLRQTLVMAIGSDKLEKNSRFPRDRGDAELKTSRVETEHSPQLAVRLSQTVSKIQKTPNSDGSDISLSPEERRPKEDLQIDEAPTS